MRPRLEMKSPFLKKPLPVLVAVVSTAIGAPSVLSHAMLFVDLVLPAGEPEQHDDEGDQGTLGGHVEAEREPQDYDGIERHHEHVDHEREDEPQCQHDQHETAGLVPISRTVRFCHGTPPKRPALRYGRAELPDVLFATDRAATPQLPERRRGIGFLLAFTFS